MQTLTKESPNSLIQQGRANEVPVAIVGAGVSGLVCAYALRKAGIHAQILEASARPGGMIRSERREGFLLELGPQSFTGTAPLLDLCRDLGMAGQLLDAPPRLARFLLIDGLLKPAPLSPPSFFVSALFGVSTKWSVLRDVFGRTQPPDGDESVAAFVRRKFSVELLDKLVGPFVSGIYAGDPERLSLRAAFPRLYEAEHSAGSIIRGMIRAAKFPRQTKDHHASGASRPTTTGPKQRPSLQAFRDGNETLITALASKLGPALRTESRVTEIRRSESGQPKRYEIAFMTKDSSHQIAADHVVVATPTNVAGAMLRSLDPGFAPILESIEYAPVAVVSLGYPRAAVGSSVEGFGFLIPRSSGLRTLGTVWNSSLFEGRAPAGQVLLTSFLGGATDPSAAALSSLEAAALVHREIAPLPSSEELVALAHKEIATILGISQPPSFTNVTQYPRALPQYNLGHSDRLTSLDNLRKQLPGLWFVGNYLRGPSIGACIDQALSLAAQIRTESA